MKKILLTIGAAITASQIASFACTSLLAGKGATTDGSTMITYNADSYVLYGELYHHPAADHKKGEMLEVREWDTNKYLGEIKQVGHTYATIGNMNEHQLAITESTWSSRPELMDTTAIMDYGSLIYITLQRARTAREAIKVMTDLVNEYGYRSTGESFSIADPNEVWIMEMVSKGMKEKGAVWVAIRIPDDCISGHANQSRIHQIPFDDKENCMYSDDVVSFARDMGYFSGKDEDFSFCNAYAVTDYLALRGCDGRVWSFYNKYATGMDKYLPYILAEGGEVLPLYIKPDRKLSVQDMQAMLRDHFDGTELDMTKDPGAGPWHSPYRFAPLIWKSDSVEYVHERPIATQQTGFTLVAQMRSWLPDEIGGILWFGVDDSAMTVYNPIYCAITKVPECYRQGNGDFAVSENLERSLGFADQSGHANGLVIDHVASLEGFSECGDVDHVEHFLDAAVEAAFRDASEGRSLTALEMMSDGSSATGLLAFMTASGGSAPVGSISSSDSHPALFGTGCRSKFMQFHGKISFLIQL